LTVATENLFSFFFFLPDGLIIAEKGVMVNVKKLKSKEKT